MKLATLILIVMAGMLAIGASHVPTQVHAHPADPPQGMPDGSEQVRRPQAVAWLGRDVVVTADRRGSLIAVTTNGTVRWRTAIGGEPSHLAIGEDGAIHASDRVGDRIVTVDATGVIRSDWRVGDRPQGLAIAGAHLLVCLSAADAIAVLDRRDGHRVATWPVGRMPVDIAVMGRQAVVANAMPRGDARRPDFAASVTLLDLGAADGAPRTITLPPGSTNVRGVAMAPDGRWAYAVHTVGHTGLPTTHPDQGWIAVNAVSIIDMQAGIRRATVLLDQPGSGAADPWGVAVAGSDLWVTASGIHALIRIDLATLHAALAGRMPPLPPRADGDTWAAVTASPSGSDLLIRDTGALTVAGIIERRALPVRGPRGLAVAGDRIAIAGTFSAAIAVQVDGQMRAIPIGLAGDSAADVGEALFHDAMPSWQQWTSCASCHPDDARMDGLNWDLPNDGVGNPKQVRSLLLAPQRSPVMSLGVRADAPTAVRAGFRFISFTEPSPAMVNHIMAYLGRLQPEPSPRLDKDGRTSPAAMRGRALFAGSAQCVGCHAGSMGSDGKAHDVGTVTDAIDAGRPVFTPMLLELWRSAPYLHDGSAPTLRDVLTTANPNGRHGTVQGLTAAEIDDLVAYLESL